MCSRCNSRGGYETYEHHPWGSTYATEQLWEDCETCVGQGKCPDCGEDIVLDEEGDWHCSKCGLMLDAARRRSDGEPLDFD